MRATKANNGWNVRWTEEEDQFLRDNYSNHGAKWCAKTFNTRTAEGWRTRAYRLGIKLAYKNKTHKKLNSKAENNICKFYKDGLSAQEVIEELGLNICVDLVYQVLRSNNIRIDKTGTRNKRWSAEEELVICDLYRKGADMIKIANIYMTSSSTIDLVLTRHNIEVREAAFGGKRLVSYTDKLNRNFKMKSSWEIATANWLDSKDILWDYELNSFDVMIDGRIRRYTPDFWIYSSGEVYLVDVKGVFKDFQIRKINELVNQRPDLNIRIWDYWELKSRGILPGEMSKILFSK